MYGGGLVALSSMGLKRCPRCKTTRFIIDFRKSKHQPGGFRAYCKICDRDYERLQYKKHKTKRDKAHKRWAAANKERLRIYVNSKERKAYRNEYRKRRLLELRDEFLSEYGGKCSCCDESIREFLTVEHINHDGKKDRRKSYSFFLRLKKAGWPKGNITILCWNCNCATRFGEKCPHEILRRG